MVITKAEAGYPIIYVNSGFGELTGYGPHEVIGKSPSMLQGPNTDRAVTERLENDISKGRLLHGQAIEYWKDGSDL
ncbi:MAG: PAS domain-containing protein [Desulfobacterales bacterium]|nr:PAS domain-containing protein [Desulfobacterales bacterium]MDH3827428.1 PAS domain-containing protein [Desulfobacterales bacterium]